MYLYTIFFMINLEPSFELRLYNVAKIKNLRMARIIQYRRGRYVKTKIQDIFQGLLRQ